MLNFIHFANKITHPYIEIKDEKEVNEFLYAMEEYREETDIFKNGFIPLGEEFYSLKSKHRVIAIFHDRSSFPSIFQKFEEACYALANREDLRVGVLFDKVKIVNYVKSIKQSLPSNTKNLILLTNDV